ncbi:MAG: hypothetical protein AAF268_09105 [Cyanobacteria bacterium P01_A01_bin.3]
MSLQIYAMADEKAKTAQSTIKSTQIMGIRKCNERSRDLHIASAPPQLLKDSESD